MSAFSGMRIPRVATPHLGKFAVLGALALATSACGHMGVPAAPSGLIPHLGSKPAVNAPAAGIGVNTYLWRASLDTLAFMPLASADPFGGVILTDWYVNPEKTDERFKVTVYILDTRLRADGLNVTVFKQAKDAKGEWIAAPVAGQTDIDIENAILTRARQLRLSNLNDRG
jgi:hypothetical protein